MQVLLSSQHLEEVSTARYSWPPSPAYKCVSSSAGIQVDLSYCEQVAIHNIEFFLESVIERPNPKLKKLTIGYLGGCRPQVSASSKFHYHYIPFAYTATHTLQKAVLRPGRFTASIQAESRESLMKQLI